MGKEFIHSREDIRDILHWADSIGLLLLLPQYLDKKEVRPKKLQEVRSFSGGTILLYRPEWVMADIEVMLIDSGIDAGKYVIPTGVNFSSIKLSFQGDEDIGGARRLGGGYVSYDREWLHREAHEMRLSPPEVAQTYKQVCKQLFSKISVRGGVHNYHVCKEAAELATRIPTRPPFDYIPWPPPDLDKVRKR